MTETAKLAKLQVGVEAYKAKNAENGWTGRGYALDPFFLNLNRDGGASVGFSENDANYERDDETGRTYIYCNAPVSEILALRDFLNEAFPVIPAGETAPCPACDGSGVEVFAVTVYEPGCGYSHDSTDERPCPTCDGKGMVGWLDPGEGIRVEPCPDCGSSRTKYESGMGERLTCFACGRVGPPQSEKRPQVSDDDITF